MQLLTQKCVFDFSPYSRLFHLHMIVANNAAEFSKTGNGIKPVLIHVYLSDLLHYYVYHSNYI